MKKNYNIIIFDLDGTLVNSLYDLHAAVDYALTINNYPTRTVEEVRSFVGNGIRNLVERAVPEGIDVKEIDKVFETFKGYYDIHATDRTYPYDGIMELLINLKKEGYYVGISTNKVQSAVDILYNKFFKDVCGIALGDSSHRKRKPFPDSVNEIVEFYNGELSEVLYVGDSEVDIQTGANAGVDMVTVTWGFRDKQTLQNAGAKMVVDTVEELAEIIGLKKS